MLSARYRTLIKHQNFSLLRSNCNTFDVTGLKFSFYFEPLEVVPEAGCRYLESS